MTTPRTALVPQLRAVGGPLNGQTMPAQLAAPHVREVTLYAWRPGCYVVREATMPADVALPLQPGGLHRTAIDLRMPSYVYQAGPERAQGGASGGALGGGWPANPHGLRPGPELVGSYVREPEPSAPFGAWWRYEQRWQLVGADVLGRVCDAKGCPFPATRQVAVAPLAGFNADLHAACTYHEAVMRGTLTVTASLPIDAPLLDPNWTMEVEEARYQARLRAWSAAAAERRRALVGGNESAATALRPCLMYCGRWLAWGAGGPVVCLSCWATYYTAGAGR